MADNEMNFANEFPEGIDEMETTAVAAAEPAQTYTLNDGSQGSRAAFIREKFLVDNMSRKDIAEKFDFQYRVVYSATVNMTNGAEAPQRGRTASNATLKLTVDGKCVREKDGILYLDGDVFDGSIDELGDLHEVSRNTWIKEQVEAGVSRGDLAKILDMSYGVIYSITKEQEGTRARIEIELADGSKVSRAEYIRMQFAAGVSRGAIAKELNVPYSVVWQATKTEKTEADHFAEVIAELKTYAGKTNNEDLFAQICAALDTIDIEIPAEEPATEE